MRTARHRVRLENGDSVGVFRNLIRGTQKEYSKVYTFVQIYFWPLTITGGAAFLDLEIMDKMTCKPSIW